MIITPLELLQKQLLELERDKEKSQEMFTNRVIGQHTHLMYLSNLEPAIKEYKLAIFKLNEAHF